jgi:acyl carrier protein
MDEVHLTDSVVRALATELKVDDVRVRSAGSLKSDLGMDSIAVVNVAFALEDELGCEIDIVEGESFDSVSAILSVIRRVLGRS